MALAVGVVLAGMLARYFSGEEFGLWSILVSVRGIVPSGLDFGFGSALRNKMAQMYAQNRDEENRVYFLSIFYWFSFIACLLSIIFLLVKPAIPWSGLFKSSDVSLIWIGAWLVTVGTSILAFNIAFNVYTAGFFSYQESHWNGAVNGSSKLALLLLTGLFVLSRRGFFSINLLAFVVSLVSSIIGFFSFLRVRKWKFTRVPVVTVLTAVKEMWRKSAQFACLQVFSSILLLADVFVVSKILGLEMVGEYFLVKRLYFVLAGLHFAILLPVWSAYTESIESGDIAWTRRALRKTTVLTACVFGLGTALFCFAGKYFIYWWTGKQIINQSLFIWLGTWGFIYGWSNCFSVFLNAAGRLKYQVILGGFGTASFIPLSLFWAGSHGIVGVCMALVAVSLPFAVLGPVESVSFLRCLDKTNRRMVVAGHHE